jgi:uncharacterized membrane protein
MVGTRSVLTKLSVIHLPRGTSTRDKVRDPMSFRSLVSIAAAASLGIACLSTDAFAFRGGGGVRAGGVHASGARVTGGAYRGGGYRDGAYPGGYRPGWGVGAAAAGAAIGVAAAGLRWRPLTTTIAMITLSTLSTLSADTPPTRPAIEIGNGAEEFQRAASKPPSMHRVQATSQSAMRA